MVDIIATIGPASNSRTILKRMASSGMTTARINTKYGSINQYEEMLGNLRGLKCKILFDIKNMGILKWIKIQRPDYVAVSFAESVKQIRDVRKIVGSRTKIIAKIETKKGINNIDNLIKESDGIMVARGDLGKNIPIEKVPIFQKIIIKKCNRKRKMVITATEMLLSMTKSKVPERAEVSDVANAVLDGSDALMLSEETAIGRYPVLAVKIMNKIIKETEKMRKLI